MEEKSGEKSFPRSYRYIFIKHIGTANLFDYSYSWNIAPSIRNGGGYVVRISTGRRIVPLLRPLKASISSNEIWSETNTTTRNIGKGVLIKPIVYGQSGEFSITGQVPPISSNIDRVIKLLETIQKQLIEAIQLLKEIAVTK